MPCDPVRAAATSPRAALRRCASAVLLLSIATSPALPAGMEALPALIPAPAELHISDNAGFTLNANTAIVAGPDARAVATYAATVLGASVGHALDLAQPSPAGGASIRLQVSSRDATLAPGAYRLDVADAGIVAVAADEEGLFHAVQTLRQLASNGADDKSARLPTVRIVDTPRFRWRGLLVDVAAHFRGKDTLKQVIEQLASYKMNVLHLHLTDYGGWRVEVRSYPRLTSVGARGDLEQPGAGEPRFYSEADVQELVACAAANHVTLVPEIEMPGHAGAAARAYPEYFDGSGTFNPAAPGVYDFIAGVVRDVSRQFPGAYFHFGGDEVGTEGWTKLPEVQRLMQAEGLKTPAELQRYFYNRVAAIIRSAGRRPMAWDETAETGVDAGVTIQWWRKARPDVRNQALARGAELVLSPVDQVYLDYAAAPGEPGSPWEGNDNGPTSIEKILRWNPLAGIPASVPRPQIAGVEAALWTQFIRSEPFFEFMLYPRLLAVAEVAWSPAGPRDVADFQRRLAPHLQRLRALGLNARTREADAYPYLTH